MKSQILVILAVWAFSFCTIFESTSALATDVETLKATTESKDKHHDDKDVKHDSDIDDLKTKHLSKKARIEALEAGLQILQTELATIQLTPGPQGEQGLPGIDGQDGVSITGECQPGEFQVGIGPNGIICETTPPSCPCFNLLDVISTIAELNPTQTNCYSGTTASGITIDKALTQSGQGLQLVAQTVADSWLPVSCGETHILPDFTTTVDSNSNLTQQDAEVCKQILDTACYVIPSTCSGSACIPSSGV